MHMPTVTPEIVLNAYAAGIFPMAEDAGDPSLFWVEPKMRGILPLKGFRINHRLARTIRSNHFSVRTDRDFDAVIDGCAQLRPGSDATWINARIRELYGALFRMGYCHTIEVYRDDRLVGGLYGIALGAAFFGESMFHTERDASKVALAHLVARLRMGGFALLDIQFVTSHLMQFGAMEIPRRNYRKLLKAALEMEASWDSLPAQIANDGRAIARILASESVNGVD